jgi:hypothetical protein
MSRNYIHLAKGVVGDVVNGTPSPIPQSLAEPVAPRA